MSRQRGVPPAHRATTVELRTLYPFVIPDVLGVDGCYIGREASGGLFCFDPWECYAKGKLTSPNIVVFGQIGRGKSAFVKSFIWRQRIFGRQCWVLDPKGEYEALALACGGSPLRLRRARPPAQPASTLAPPYARRCRPGSLRPSSAGETAPAPRPRWPGEQWPAAGTSVGRGRTRRVWLPAHQRRADLLGALLGSSLGRLLQPEERAAADVALNAAEERSAVPTLAVVADALLNPEPRQAELLGTDAEGLRQDGRPVALELRRLVHGDLAGMFDGETSPGVELGAGMVVLDLSRLYASPALGLLMVCALSLGCQSALARPACGQAPCRAGRSVGRPQPSRHRPLATGHLQTVACLRGGQCGRCAPALRFEGSRPGRLPATAAGRALPLVDAETHAWLFRPGPTGKPSGARANCSACPGPTQVHSSASSLGAWPCGG